MEERENVYVKVKDGCVVVRNHAFKQWYTLDPARNEGRAEEDAKSVRETIALAIADAKKEVGKVGDILTRHEQLARRVTVLEYFAREHYHILPAETEVRSTRTGIDGVFVEK